MFVSLHISSTPLNFLIECPRFLHKTDESQTHFALRTKLIFAYHSIDRTHKLHSRESNRCFGLQTEKLRVVRAKINIAKVAKHGAKFAEISNSANVCSPLSDWRNSSFCQPQSQQGATSIVSSNVWQKGQWVSCIIAMATASSTRSYAKNCDAMCVGKLVDASISPTNCSP